MLRRTRLILGATVVLLGFGVYALGFLADESGVRYVEDVHNDPAAHAEGTYTLIGLLQPPTVTTTGPEGARTDVNPSYQDTTVFARATTGPDGEAWLVSHRLRAEPTPTGTTWNLTTTTRDQETAQVVSVAYEEWSDDSHGELFQLESFDESGARIWARFDGAIKDMIVKPGQLTGRLSADVPQGALVFDVDELALQCSSKFIPEERRDEFADYTD